MNERLNLQLLEHRRFPRYSCRGAAEILQSGRHSGQGTVSKISRGGCYVETAQPLPLGTEVQLRLIVADTGLFIGAKVAYTDPRGGMGMEFMVVPPTQKNNLAQIIEEITVSDPFFAVLQAERTQPNIVFRITREAAPDILATIIKRINEKGALTRQDLLDIVKSQKTDNKLPLT
jgi:hypothetical protein